MIFISNIYFENYFLDDEKKIKSKKKLILVIYDITDNKRRSKFVKLLESYGKRVQKSAFEMILNQKQYDELVAKIPLYIIQEDNVRIYKLRLEGEVLAWGSNLTQAEEVVII